MERNCPLCHNDQYREKYFADEYRVVQCRQCGFVYTLNPPKNSSSQETYNNYFESSTVVELGPDSDDAKANNIYKKRLDIIHGLKNSGSLLEIGCGRGYFLNLAKQAGYLVKGIEISPVAAHYAGLHYGLDVDISDFETMPQSDESFDIIVLWHVLEHFRDPVSVLELVYGLLNENGIVLIEVPNLNSIKFRLSAMNSKWQGGNHPQYHLSFFTMNSLKEMILKIGFSAVKNLHIQYPGQNNIIKSFVKKVANQFNSDSFLSIVVYKR